MQNKFVFLADFAEMIRETLPQEKQAEAYQAICEYGIYGELPEDPMLKGMCLMIKINMAKRGAPLGNQNAKKQIKQFETNNVIDLFENNSKQIKQFNQLKEKKEKRKEPKENNKKNKNISLTLESKLSSASPYEKPTLEEVGGETVDLEELIAEQKLKETQNKVRKFKKPTLEEVGEYCSERKNGINPVAFVNFYESKGWMVGKSPMKDWQAAVRTWEQKRKNDPPEKSEISEVEKQKQQELITKIFGE